jgi:hypothetical protein
MVPGCFSTPHRTNAARVEEARAQPPVGTPSARAPLRGPSEPTPLPGSSRVFDPTLLAVDVPQDMPVDSTAAAPISFVRPDAKEPGRWLTNSSTLVFSGTCAPAGPPIEVARNVPTSAPAQVPCRAGYAGTGRWRFEAHDLATPGERSYVFAQGDRSSAITLTVDPAARPTSSRLSLTRERKALVPIVVSPHASKDLRALAAELASHLERATGARFEILDGDGREGVVVGTTADIDVGPDARALELRGPFDGREAYVVRSEPRRLLLAGATVLGAQDAVYRFLESIGYRWFFPNEAWTVTPSAPDLTVDVYLRERPRFLSRGMFYGDGDFDPQTRTDFLAWTRRNRMNAGMNVPNGHAWQAIIVRNKARFQAHPEYFACETPSKGAAAGPADPECTGGRKVTGDKLCVTNLADDDDDGSRLARATADGTLKSMVDSGRLADLGVQGLALEYVLHALDASPGADGVSLEASDGIGRCNCDRCKKLATSSDYVFHLAKAVGEALEVLRPGKMLGLLAYGDHSDPPTFQLPSNVAVQITTGYSASKVPLDERISHWVTLVPYVGFYDYYSVYLHDSDCIPGGAAANTSFVAASIGSREDLGAVSQLNESTGNWGLHGLGYYLSARTMWDGAADRRAILDDFYERAFGPAATTMRRFYERLDGSNEPLFTADLLGRLMSDLDLASRTAESHGRADVSQRLILLKQFLRTEDLWWRLAHSPEEEAKKLALELLVHGYRSRRGYMNHWRGMLYWQTVAFAKRFREPSWSRAFGDGRGPWPWRVEPPETRDEIEAAFQRGLAYYKPRIVNFPETKYSDRAVRVDWSLPEGAPAGEEDSYAYQGSNRFVVRSPTGAPLRVTVKSGTIGIYGEGGQVEKPPAEWKLSSPPSAGGAIIARGAVKNDARETALEIPVPGPGTYTFEFGSTSGVTVKFPSATGAAQLRGHVFANTMGRTAPSFFYVPKRTKRFAVYIAAPAGTAAICSTDGTIVATADRADEMLSISVPRHADGAVWHTCAARGKAPSAPLVVSKLVLFGVPGLTSGSLSNLMVPEDVAAADGLRVIAK